MNATVHQVQRLLAAEFERRGWTYDVSACRGIAESLVAAPTSDSRQLARGVDLYVLAQQVPARSDVVDAIEAVKAGVAPA